MVSKEYVTLLGLFVMVFLISSEVIARDLANDSSLSAMAMNVKEPQKVASDVKYGKNTCTEDLDHPDCFFSGMPGMLGGGGGIPAKPGVFGGIFGRPGGGIPGEGYMRGIPIDMPGVPLDGGPSTQP